MRLRPAHLAAVLAAAGLAVLPSLPASAGTAGHSISAEPTALKPGDNTTVTGNAASCPSAAYTLTLTYTDPNEDTQTATVSGTTDAEGGYSQVIAAPEDALPEEPASLQSTVTCQQGDEPTQVASNMVALTIEAHVGTLSINPSSGPTGTEVAISGTNCWGDDIVVFFNGDDVGTEVEDVTLNDDRTFSATFTIPADYPAGDYAFGAGCPGTDFEPQAFTITASAAEPNPDPDPVDPAEPAVPVVDVVTFTG